MTFSGGVVEVTICLLVGRSKGCSLLHMPSISVISTNIYVRYIWIYMRTHVPMLCHVQAIQMNYVLRLICPVFSMQSSSALVLGESDSILSIVWLPEVRVPCIWFSSCRTPKTPVMTYVAGALGIIDGERIKH